MLLSRIPRAADVVYFSVKQAALVRHLRDHLLTDRDGYVSLSQLAAEHDISVSHLQKLFKQIYGVPVYHYIKEYRLEQAAVELVRSQKSVTKYCKGAGYDNASKFFRKALNAMAPPSQYRLRKQRIRQNRAAKPKRVSLSNWYMVKYALVSKKLTQFQEDNFYEKERIIVLSVVIFCLLSAVGCTSSAPAEAAVSETTASETMVTESPTVEATAAAEGSASGDYLSSIGGTYVELFPELSKPGYRQIWIDAVTPLVGAENAEATTDMLPGMLKAGICGKKPPKNMRRTQTAWPLTAIFLAAFRNS